MSNEQADRESSDKAIVQLLGQNPQGLSALMVTHGLMRLGVSAYVAQRAIQRGLNSGDIALGKKLALRLP